MARWYRGWGGATVHTGRAVLNFIKAKFSILKYCLIFLSCVSHQWVANMALFHS